MPDKVVLVTGATGLLGRQCLKAFESADFKVLGTGYSRAKPPQIHKLDLSDATAVTSLLSSTSPIAVVHCAAERSPDACANNPEGTKALNVEATAHLAAECAKRGILLVYISTDYVFSGAQGEAPYLPNSPTAPPNFYGETKLAGEEEVTKRGGVVIRVPVLYGEVENGRMGESAINTLLDVVWNREGKETVEMDHWSIRYPTNTEDVARVLKDVVELYSEKSKEDRGKLPKVLQFSSEDRMTKYEICQILGDIMGLPTDHIVPNDTNDPNAVVQRPYDCHLSTQALKDCNISVATVPFRDWWQRYLRAYKK